jgi:uncharacterized protein (DUF488 family)
MKLYTIGHGNHALEKLVQLLMDNDITQLVDVRTAPYSKFNPQFNKPSLEHSLPLYDITYAFAGKWLGGRPTDPTCYKSRALPAEGDEVDFLHEVDYPAVMERDWFRKGITRLLQLAEAQLTAVMCSEENPAECHRHHLIAKYLMQHYPELEIQHIRGDGAVFNARSLHVTVERPKAVQPTLF